MPFEFTPAQRAALSTRLMVQDPRTLGLTPAQLARVRADMERRVQGIPLGDLLALEAMYHLADQGNVVAQDVIDQMIAHYDLDPRRFRYETTGLAEAVERTG